MWAYERTFYQIYPLGMCGAPGENDGVTVPRIRRVLDWVDHLEKLGVGAVVFNPVFQSDRHGYDTGISSPWTAAWAPIRTSGTCAAACTAGA